MPEQLSVIFDMDGVLVRSYGPHFQSWIQVAAKHGLALTESQFAASFGKATREIIRENWPGVFDDAGVARFDAEKEAAYRDILAHDLPEMPGAAQLIADLHTAGFLLAIGSSGPPENVALVHRRITHGNLISATVDAMQVKLGKPAPDVFLAAAKKIGVPPARCAVIEDAPVGIEAARRAGMSPIGLTGTVKRPALAGAKLIVDSLTELTPAKITALIRSS